MFLASPALTARFFTTVPPREALYAEYIVQNVGLDESQAGIKTAKEIPTTSDIQMIPL